MSNILVLDKNPELIKDVPLYSLLFKQCPTTEKRLMIIEQLTLDYIRGDNEQGAVKVLSLLWPCILEMTVLEGLDGIRLFKMQEGKNTCQLYSVDLSKAGAVKLDEALIKYAERLDYLILNAFTHLKRGARVPEEFIEYASKEMARAIHIMSDSKRSGSLFDALICRMGYQYPAESCALMKKAPRILKESFQNLPEREGQSLSANLLEYMVVIEERLERTDERPRCAEIEELSRVVSFALCRHVHPRLIRKMIINENLVRKSF